MDILIKNMEMPNSCYTCALRKKTWDKYNWYEKCMASGHKERYQDKFTKYEVVGLLMEQCPLVEVPPHGRLIDADQLQEVLNIVLSLVITNKLTDMEIELVHRTIGAISDEINDMDTILEEST